MPTNFCAKPSSTPSLAAKQSKGKSRHVSGQELLEGIRQFALAQFGPMTMSVFAEWGIHSGADFGEIVFNLVESKLLSKTETDSQADFQNGYDFFEAFRRPFLPSSKDSRQQSESRRINGRRALVVEHKYDDVRCAQFGLWQGRVLPHWPQHTPQWVVTTSNAAQAKFGATSGRQCFFGQTSLLAPYRSTAGYPPRAEAPRASSGQKSLAANVIVFMFMTT
jgi:uncharacterized repeat protein (TIGR04138 family)